MLTAEDELEAMLCGTGERWTVHKLAETIKCDHGCALGSLLLVSNLLSAIL